MSAIITEFICSTIMAIMGFVVIKIFIKSKVSFFSIKTIILMLFLILLPMTIYNVEYTYLYTIIVYIIMCITYKYIFNISLFKSIVSCGIIYGLLAILDLLVVGFFIIFVTLQQIRELWYLSIISNIITSSLLIGFFFIPYVKIKVSLFVDKIESKQSYKIIIFFILSIIGIVTILYSVSINCKINNVFTNNFLISIILFMLIIILIGEQNNYDKLSLEYDNLLNYVKVFEDWIENEQLNRHEYKNQLAVLRCMTKEKKVKEKIDSIVNEFINIDSEMINQLKNLPSGGFKGLLYYKIVVARNQKINIEVDVSYDVSKSFKNISEEKLKILSKLIGIYCDNAIEAAKETKNKIVLIEIYECNENINIVISNTFNMSEQFSNRYKKGISTKGLGRGNGLYFATKMLSKNKWIEEKQEVIKNLYIQKLIIQTKTRKES